MFLKDIDILSPEITLFYNHSLCHSSKISGILTIITIIIIILFAIFYIKDILNRDKEVPTIHSYNLYKEDAGEFLINSSSFFHFISIVKDPHHPENEELDFTAFNLIGLDTYTKDYENDNDLSKYNHWLYGLCNIENDLKGINDLVTQNYFIKSACIRQYFDSTQQKYYSTDDPNFKWPKMAHGTFNPNNEFYSIILIKCKNEILNKVFGDEYKCKNENEITEIINLKGKVHFNFIDQYVDILNYKTPNKKYIYRIENSLDNDNYSVNHLNFNPSIIKTHNGFILEKYIEEKGYFYDRNDVFTYLRKGDIHMIYSLWMNNRMNYNERTYKKIQDILSEVGGVAQAIMTIALFMNNFINRYIILYDTQQLLNKANISITEICAKKKEIKINESYNCEFTSVKEINKDEINSICPETKEEIMEKKENSVNQKQDIEKPIYNNDQNYKYEEPEIVDKINNKKNENSGKNNKSKEKLSFWNFFVYKLSFGKKHNIMRIYEAFREKVISVENLTRNHLNILNLLKFNKINKVS